MNLTSNSGIDFIAFAKASGTDLDEMIASEDFAEWFREYLSENIVEITFTKKDGTPRVMKCTRDIGKIPIEKHPTGSGTGNASCTIQAFDLDIKEWRSFNTPSLTHINW